MISGTRVSASQFIHLLLFLLADHDRWLLERNDWRLRLVLWSCLFESPEYLFAASQAITAMGPSSAAITS